MRQGIFQMRQEGRLFCNFVISICEVKELQKTFRGILQHSFLFLVRLIKLTFLFSECLWIGDAILWWFLDRCTSRGGPLTEQTIRWVFLDTFSIILSVSALLFLNGLLKWDGSSVLILKLTPMFSQGNGIDSPYGIQCSCTRFYVLWPPLVDP